MKRQKSQDEQKQGLPEWMGTYGDMVTLLLTFFVMLFAMSTVNEQKFEQIVNSIQGSLGIQMQGKSINDDALVADGIDNALELNEMIENMNPENNDNEDMQELFVQIQNYINENNLGDSVVISQEEPGLLIRFKENVLFDSGKADLKSGAKDILDDISEILKAFDKHIRVEGHTDNVPIHNREFPSNWELSARRAANVVRYFIEGNKIEPTRLSLSGYGEYHPVADNSTLEGRQKNRRVDVVILKEYIWNELSTDEGGQ